ncbi:hypothetical protein [Coprococcus comes]|uniref:hypothetical protein n=1 Tax=Coprococcus comes TaxID=410072 RepID=UPI003D7BD4B6
MKFFYKQTGIIVESDEMLDSTMFRPVEKEPELKEEPEKKPVKKTATAGRKTPVAKK